MAQINIKLTDEQKEAINSIAKSEGKSVTQLIIDSILSKEDSVESKEKSIEDSLFFIEPLFEQLKQKDIQIEELNERLRESHLLLNEAQKSQQLLLEDSSKRESFWKRIFKRN